MLFFDDASEDLFTLDVAIITLVGLFISPKLAALFLAAALLSWAFLWKR